MRSIVFAVLLAAFVGGGCSATGPAYRVSHVPDPAIRVDGRLDEQPWQQARALRRFGDPWRHGGLPTEFRAFRDDRNLYFAFTAEDRTPRVEEVWRGEKTVDNEDRVEIFIAPDAKLERYYCLEIDPKGRVHDFAGAFRRKFDDAWAMPGLKTAGRDTPHGYVVEGSIPLESMEALGMPPAGAGQRWRIGVFRGDMGLERSDPTYWISWIAPAAPKPDFHIPSAFGEFQFGRTRR